MEQADRDRRELVLVLCKAALYVIAYLNRKYDLRLRVASPDLKNN